MRLEVFDPEMCCTSGVCGSAPDPTLVRMEETVERLKLEGVSVSRYQLSRNAQMFTENPTVYRTLLESGTAALPIIAVDGLVKFVGRYPTYEEIRVSLGQEA